MKNTTRNGCRCVICTLQARCRSWFFHINLGDVCQNRIISITMILVVTDWWWVEKGSLKPFYFLPSKRGVGWACWRHVGGRFDCHLFLLTEVFLLSTVGRARTFPLTQQLGLSANQAPAWLSAAGIVKKALGGGVMSGAEQAWGGGEGMGPKVVEEWGKRSREGQHVLKAWSEKWVEKQYMRKRTSTSEE